MGSIRIPLKGHGKKVWLVLKLLRTLYKQHWAGILVGSSDTGSRVIRSSEAEREKERKSTLFLQSKRLLFVWDPGQGIPIGGKPAKRLQILWITLSVISHSAFCYFYFTINRKIILFIVDKFENKKGSLDIGILWRKEPQKWKKKKTIGHYRNHKINIFSAIGL